MLTFKSITLLTVAFACILLSGCGGYGPKVVHNSTDVYYTGGATKEQADKLGKFLVDDGFADGFPKSVQLRKAGSEGYEFRVVTKPKFLNQGEFADSFNFISLQVSNLLDGQKVRSHLCDESFTTQKVLDGLQGRLQMLGNAQVYVHDITASQLESLQTIMEENGLQESESSYHVCKDGDKFIVRMVVGPDFYDNADVLADVQRISASLSEKAFDGATVEWNLCNDSFTSQNSVSATATPALPQ